MLKYKLLSAVSYTLLNEIGFTLCELSKILRTDHFAKPCLNWAMPRDRA